MAYNTLWNDTEVIDEFYQEKEQGQYVKVYEERYTWEEFKTKWQRDSRIINFKMPKKDKLLKPTPQPPTNDGMRDVDEIIKNE